MRLDDPDLYGEVLAALDASREAIEEIPRPFDQAILGEDGSDGRTKILAAIRALQTEADRVVDVAALYDIQINLV